MGRTNNNEILQYIKESVDKGFERVDRLAERTDNNSERLVAIETHLRDMNGKLVKHDTQLTVDCPLRHKELGEEMSTRRNLLDKRISKIEIRMAKWGTAFTIANGFIIFIITNWEKVKSFFGGN